jgi:hypothetical protein
MIKQFTLDDIVDVPVRAYMVGVMGTVWCKILFKGCSEPVEFYAWDKGDDFSKTVYQAVGVDLAYGELQHGMGGFRTQPKTQQEREDEARAQRDQLLIATDWTETTAGQARLTDEQKTVYATYRSALRDISHQETFPWEITWPAKP